MKSVLKPSRSIKSTKKSLTSIGVAAILASLAVTSLFSSSGQRSLISFGAFRNDDPRNLQMNKGTNALPTTFLLGIFSYSAGEERRVYIRETYLALDDDRICPLDEFIRQTKENRRTRTCTVPYTFVMGGGGIDRPQDHNDLEPLTMETDQYGNADPAGDCTYLNIRENMEHGKSPTWLKHAANLAKEYGIDYIGKIDDDALLFPNLMFDFMEQELPPAPYNTRIYGGSPRLSRMKELVYAAGEFYFVSSDLAEYVGNTLSAREREIHRIFHHIEDLDMGTFVNSHPRPIKYINFQSYLFYWHPLKHRRDFVGWWKDHQFLWPKRHPAMQWNNYCVGVLNGEAY